MEVVVCKTSLLIGHLKVYHAEGEVVQGVAEAGGGEDVGGEGAIGSFDPPLLKQNEVSFSDEL